MLGPPPFQVDHLWMCFTPVQKQAELQLNLDKFCLVSFSLCVRGLQTNWAYTQSFCSSSLNKIWNSPLFSVHSRRRHCHVFIHKKKKKRKKSISQHSACVFRCIYSVSCSSFLTGIFLLLLSPCLMNQTPTVRPTVRRLSFTRKTSGSTRSACLPS